MLKNASQLLRGFKRHFGITDEGSPQRLSETISPVFDLWSRPEALLEADIILAGGYYSVGAGGAGFRSQLQLWNPADSGRVVVCTHYFASVANSTLKINSAALGTLVTGTVGAHDLRSVTSFLLPDRRIRAQMRWSNSAAAVGIVRDLFPQTNVYQSGRPWIIAPGSCILLDPGVDNTAITGGFMWYEYDARPGQSIGELR